MVWLKLADRLKMSLSQVKRAVTSKEFVLWKVYLDEEVNSFHREDYFLAQIALILAQANSKPGKKFEMKDFLIKFKSDQPAKEKTSDQAQLAAEQKMALSKAFWLGGVGYGVRTPPKAPSKKGQLAASQQNTNQPSVIGRQPPSVGRVVSQPKPPKRLIKPPEKG